MDFAQANEHLSKIETTINFFREIAKFYLNKKAVKNSLWIPNLLESLPLDDGVECLKRIVYEFDKKEAQNVLKDALQLSIDEQTVKKSTAPFASLLPAFNAYENQILTVIGSDFSKVKTKLENLVNENSIHHAVECGGDDFLAVLCETKLTDLSLILSK